MSTVTNAQIRALFTEAMSAGDVDMAATCLLALGEFRPIVNVTSTKGPIDAGHFSDIIEALESLQPSGVSVGSLHIDVPAGDDAAAWSEALRTSARAECERVIASAAAMAD